MTEKERTKIKQRQSEVIANAKAKWKHLERHRAKDLDNLKEVYDK